MFLGLQDKGRGCSLRLSTAPERISCIFDKENMLRAPQAYRQSVSVRKAVNLMSELDRRLDWKCWGSTALCRGLPSSTAAGFLPTSMIPPRFSKSWTCITRPASATGYWKRPSTRAWSRGSGPCSSRSFTPEETPMISRRIVFWRCTAYYSRQKAGKEISAYCQAD